MTTTYKGFNQDLACTPNGVTFQYEVGKTYTTDKTVTRCGAGAFHSVEMPLDAWNYYAPGESRYAETEIGGTVARGGAGSDTKVASAELTVRAELTLPEFIRKAVDWVVARAADKLATGDSGHAAATGDSGHAAATGNRSHAAATGNRSHAAATGNYGHAAATGYGGHAAATGYSGHAAATGNYGHAAATGDSGRAAATGYSGHAAATGHRGHAAATGNSGHAAATGNYGHADVKGSNAIAVAVGPGGTAKAEEGGAIMLAFFDYAGALKKVFASEVGQNGIKPGVKYRLDSHGKPVAVKE